MGNEYSKLFESFTFDKIFYFALSKDGAFLHLAGLSGGKAQHLVDDNI